MSTVRGCPPRLCCLAGGIRGVTIAHCSSVRSEGYSFLGRSCLNMAAHSSADRICANYLINLLFCQAKFPDSLLTALLDLDEIAQRLVTTVTRALQVASAALYLDDGTGVYPPLALVGEAADRLARLRPRRDNAVVTLIARPRRGISRDDLEARPG